jgi:hypothetical protein
VLKADMQVVCVAVGPVVVAPDAGPEKILRLKMTYLIR